MYSSENRDFPVNLIHPSLCIHTFLSDQLYSDLQSDSATPKIQEYLYTLSSSLTRFRSSPSQFDFTKFSFSQCLAKDVIPKPYFPMTMLSLPRGSAASGRAL